jgi:hypothetical protein
VDARHASGGHAHVPDNGDEDGDADRAADLTCRLMLGAADGEALSRKVPYSGHTEQGDVRPNRAGPPASHDGALGRLVGNDSDRSPG